jgi:hypothetical protein
VIFPCPDSTFGWVGAMHIRGCVLDLDLIRLNESFDIVGSLVFQLVEEGTVATGGEPRIHLRVGSQEFFFGSDFDGDGLDVIGVVHIEECNVCVAAVGRDGEAS